MKDYIIIGAGVIGCFVARELSKYELDILVIDAESDIANQTSMANSAIIHSGYDPKPGTLKAKLNARGNRLYADLCKYYHVPFNQIGSLTVAFTNEGLTRLGELYQQGITNNVSVELVDKNRLFEMEPHIKSTAVGALYAPTAAIVYPWQISYAVIDHAITNGVKLNLNETVLDIKKLSEGYSVTTSKTTYQTKNIINCAGVYGAKIQAMIEEVKYQINPRKGEYYVLERGNSEYVNHIIFPLPTSRGKGVLANPISEREILIGPTSEFVDSFDDTSTTDVKLEYLKTEILKTMDNMPVERIIRSFSGLRASSEKRDFIIEESEYNPGLFHVIGIESPGFASAPAIAEYLALIAGFSKHKLKTNFKAYTPTTRIQSLTKLVRYSKISQNADYGKIICRCEQISLQEIKESLKGNIAATTIKGVKKRVRPGAGKCQGGFCECDVVKIIAKTHNIPIKDVCYDGPTSQIILAKSKEVIKNEKL